MSVFRKKFETTDEDIHLILDKNPGIRLIQTKERGGDTVFLGKKGQMLIFRYIWNSGEFFSDHDIADLMYKTIYK